jgi:hypothetical protein
VPIRCQGIDLNAVLRNMPARRATFPLKYLGLPLSSSRLKKSDFQFLIDKISNKLSGWNGKNLSMAGRLTLVKSVITSQAIYLLSALRAPKEILNLIDSRRKKFLWAGCAQITGGKCKVNWLRSARPKECGGLGILHLTKFARALRLRWLWQEWASSTRFWTTLELPCTTKDRQLFAATTSISVGDGTKVSLWNDAWVQGLRPKDIAPLIFNVSRRKNRSLSEALWNHTWIRDLNLFSAEVTEQHIVEYCRLWSILRRVSLQPGICDSISWKLSEDRQYSAKSAYLAQFLGSELTNMNWIIWKVWAPPKCKFFSWLAIQNRIWTADRLAKRDWPHNDVCALCGQTLESGLHFFVECRLTKRIWGEVVVWATVEGLSPSN